MRVKRQHKITFFLDVPPHVCPKDFVENRNISNILEDAPPLLNKLMFIVIGARDFSPEITVHLIGTKVPCFDKVPPPKIPICRGANYAIAC